MAAPFNLFRSIDPLLASEVVADEVLFTAVHQDSPVLTENCRDSILNELLDAVREQEYLNHSITLFPAGGYLLPGQPAHHCEQENFVIPLIS